jgi:hypothetical protein
VSTDVTVETRIARPRAEVAGYAMDPANDRSYEFEDAAGGTLMRIRTTGDASGFYRLAGPMLAAAVRRGVAWDLARLKLLLEGAG